MKNKFTFIVGLFLFIACSLMAQNNTDDFAAKVNQLLIAEKVHLPQINIPIIADSFALQGNTINIYFNKTKTYSKGSLPADYIEMLPEILLPITTHLTNTKLTLLAKETNTNNWKTLDYFGNHEPAVIYKPIINTDPFEARSGSNANAVNRVFPTTGSPTPTGALAGKTVWLSPGHGWHNTGIGFVTQRGTTNAIVEDFTTIESVDNYLMQYLYNAGANVWSVRERDINPAEIIVDNDLPVSGYSETGTWTTGSVAGYGGTYRVATTAATEDATAIFIPGVITSGYYWVSVRCIAGSNRATDVGFTVIHSGDTSKVKVNQEIHGETWVYVGQFYFTAGGNNKIILSNQSSEAAQAIIADAVRLGGGIGATADCVNTTQGVSGKPRFEESARQYAKFQGHPPCTEDVTVRPKFSEYELSKGTPTEVNNAVFVSWHTNAGGGNGTESYVYDGTGSGRPNVTAGSVDLRNFIHNQVVADIRAAWNPAWADRGVKVANFGEIRELNTMPGTLIELAFHDLAANATDLKHPEFRRIAARAFYKGILKFFNNRDGAPLVFLPESPTNVVAKNIGANKIQVSWIAPITGGANGDAATAYKIYTSTNGRSFKDGIAVTGTTFTFTGNAQTIYYFKVAATNAGGESFTSSVVAAKTPATGLTAVPYLIVDAFDRLDGAALIPRVESAALGTVNRMMLDRMNRYDYMIEHAEGLSACNNFAFDGCQNEAVTNGNILLAPYLAVDWFTGEESTVDKAISPAEITLLKTYLNAGGNLLISGSEIGWDIGRAASANVDLDFYNNYLKATYIDDDANTYNFNGTTTLFNGGTGTFDNSNNGYYDVDFPDRVAANGGSNIVLNYNGGTADGAGVGYQGTYKMLYFAFPIEAITTTSVRNALICNAVAYLTPSLAPPATSITNIANNNAGIFTILNNPATSAINIKMLKNAPANIKVFNGIGQLVYTNKSIAAGVISITNKNLQKGMYFVSVTQNKITQVGKVVVQ
jgi:N-acetylmuramoyl-L-alanine amidase